VNLFVGTSGYAYKEWKGPFYPEKLAQKDMLAYYGQHFNAVEINNTYYRMPKDSVLMGWAAEVPPPFQFVLKASRRITHFKRLKDTEGELDYFLRTSSILQQRLGPTFFQLPPNFAQDLDRLDAFLATLPTQWRAGFEFRHPSWFSDATYDTLRRHSAALVVAETDDHEPDAVPFASTAPWGYLRLRRTQYADDELRAWAERVRAQQWSDAYVFFKHEDKGTGPSLAKRFLEIWGS
jgi:uncharacterized protein YecE (DUF72 family)